jgi:non-ribosomal peptide synthetase component F
VRDPLPPVPLSYPAWGAAERACWQPAELKQRAAFWKTYLAGSERLWGGLEGAGTASGANFRKFSHFPADLTAAARELARRHESTLFSTLLTAFQIALSQWTNREDIVVGTPVANRSRQDTRETMGYFAGIVPLRARVDRDRPFSTSLRATHQSTVDAFANAMPFVELVQELGGMSAPGHNPVFEIRFALQNHPIPDVALPGLSAKLSMRSTGTARFHLACEITEDDERLEVVWLFRPNIFPEEEIDNLRDIFQAVLAGACRSPESRLAALNS